jgi:hypothetical protein
VVQPQRHQPRKERLPARFLIHIPVSRLLPVYLRDWFRDCTIDFLEMNHSPSNGGYPANDGAPGEGGASADGGQAGPSEAAPGPLDNLEADIQYHSTMIRCLRAELSEWRAKERMAREAADKARETADKFNAQVVGHIRERDELEAELSRQRANETTLPIQDSPPHEGSYDGDQSHGEEVQAEWESGGGVIADVSPVDLADQTQSVYHSAGEEQEGGEAARGGSTPPGQIDDKGVNTEDVKRKLDFGCPSDELDSSYWEGNSLTSEQYETGVGVEPTSEGGETPESQEPVLKTDQVGSESSDPSSAAGSPDSVVAPVSLFPGPATANDPPQSPPMRPEDPSSSDPSSSVPSSSDPSSSAQISSNQSPPQSPQQSPEDQSSSDQSFSNQSSSNQSSQDPRRALAFIGSYSSRDDDSSNTDPDASPSYAQVLGGDDGEGNWPARLRPQEVRHYREAPSSEDDEESPEKEAAQEVRAEVRAEVQAEIQAEIQADPEAPAKRGRGRPRKNGGAPAPAKKGPGRPRKDKTAKAVADRGGYKSGASRRAPSSPRGGVAGRARTRHRKSRRNRKFRKRTNARNAGRTSNVRLNGIYATSASAACATHAINSRTPLNSTELAAKLATRPLLNSGNSCWRNGRNRQAAASAGSAANAIKESEKEAWRATSARSAGASTATRKGTGTAYSSAQSVWLQSTRVMGSAKPFR